MTYIRYPDAGAGASNVTAADGLSADGSCSFSDQAMTDASELAEANKIVRPTLIGCEPRHSLELSGAAGQ